LSLPRATCNQSEISLSKSLIELNLTIAALAPEKAILLELVRWKTHVPPLIADEPEKVVLDHVGALRHLCRNNVEAHGHTDHGSAIAPQGRGELILIVDDEDAVCSVTKRILEASQYRTLVAKNGAEAVALYANGANEINLALIDFNIPSMSGPDTIAMLRKIKPNVRIIVATGAYSAHGVTSATEMGVQALMKKPFDVFSLLDTLQSVLK
jgi:CheY-like chemotaxis protein